MLRVCSQLWQLWWEREEAVVYYRVILMLEYSR